MSTLTAASAEEWAQVCSDSFAPCGIDRVASDFRGTVDVSVYSPATAVVRLASEPMDVLCSRRHVTGAPRSDYMLLLHQRGGPGLMEQDGLCAEVRGAGVAVGRLTPVPVQVSHGNRPDRPEGVPRGGTALVRRCQ
jgi:hypothetical protein